MKTRIWFKTYVDIETEGDLSDDDFQRAYEETTNCSEFEYDCHEEIE